MGNNFVMTKREAIENVARIIVNRVRYHSPIVYDDEVDIKRLEDFGINVSLPIFKFEKEMTKPLLKAFALAKKVQNFNLVTTKKTKCPFALFLPSESVDLRLVQLVNKLNINYKTSSSYVPKFDIDHLKIGGKSLNLKFENFCLDKHDSINGVLVRHRQFVASGECNIVEVINSNMTESEIEIEYFKNLPLGNYFFKKENHSIKITNLFNREVCFFNSNFNLTNVYFSCVDGLENSFFACIKIKEKIVLKPYQKKAFFINFGDKKFYINLLSDMETLLESARKRCYENFDMKVFTSDKSYDEKINEVLPRDIWLAWLDGKRDVELEREYKTERQKVFVRQNGKICFNLEEYKKFREVDIFDGEEFRTVYIKNLSLENSLHIGSAVFQNLRTFCLDKIKSKTQICLHFK